MSRRVVAVALALVSVLACRAPEERARQHLALGDGHLARAELVEARRAYGAALELAPELASTRVRLVALLIAEDRFEEALVRVRRLAAEVPMSSEVTGLWGAALMRLGRVEEAREKLRLALELEPDSPLAMTDYAAALVETGEDDRALALYEAAASRGGVSPRALMTWADALGRSGRNAEALQRLEAAYATSPQLPGLQKELGERLVETDPARAIGLLETALSVEAADASLLAKLGEAYLGVGRSYEGRNLLLRARAAALPGTPIRRELSRQITAVDAATPRRGATEATPNVLLFVVDTLRADRIGAYGHDRATSPRIDRLAEAGVLFENASSQAPWTAASVATLFTGLYPSVHGIDGGVVWQQGSQEGALPFATQRTLGGAQLTLAERLRRNGYSTAGVVSNVYVNSIFGFAQGFDAFDDDHADYSVDVVNLKRRAAETNRIVLQWVARELEEPFFLFVHYNDPHWPYAPPAPFGSQWLDPDLHDAAHRHRLNERIHTAGAPLANPAPAEAEQLLALYDAEIAYVDSHLGKVIDALGRRGLRRPLLTVLTSDHGEEFLDHGSTSHGYTLYEEQLRVPLVFHWPGRLAPQRVPTPVGLVDVTPTLVELLGLNEAAAPFQGRSLAAALGGETLEPRPVFAEATYIGDRSSLRSGDLKLIESREPASLELFDLIRDASERRNLAAQRGVDTDTLAARLGEWQRANAAARAATGGPGPSVRLDERTRERLRALGYVH